MAAQLNGHASNAPTTEFTKRELFGGAIVLDLPREYLDASLLRQIPDTQEVYLSPSNDTSAVLEILDCVDEGQAGTDLWHAAVFHFDALAHDNSSTTNTILTPPPPTPISPQVLGTYSSSQPLTSFATPTPVSLCGTQKVQKFNSVTADDVVIFVSVWRIHLTSQEDPARGRKADVVLSVNVNKTKDGEAECQKVQEWFERTVNSLKMADYGLFVET